MSVLSVIELTHTVSMMTKFVVQTAYHVFIMVAVVYKENH